MPTAAPPGPSPVSSGGVSGGYQQRSGPKNTVVSDLGNNEVVSKTPRTF